jgi:hypothetical protein
MSGTMRGAGIDRVAGRRGQEWDVFQVHVKQHGRRLPSGKGMGLRCVIGVKS